MTTYLLHGLRIESPLVLAAPETRADADLTIDSITTGKIANGLPEGELLARFDQTPGYSLTSHASGYTLRLEELCEISLTRDRKNANIVVDPAVEQDLASVVIAGNLSAVVLTLGGKCAIHASAIQVEGQVLAFAAGSGGGKSTIAALFIEQGAELVTDDLLHVFEDANGVACHRGTTELRLRANADNIVARLALPSRTTPDGRSGVASKSIQADQHLLGAVSILHLVQGAGSASAERLAPAEALIELTKFPRLIGVRDTKMQRRRIEVLGATARSVPVLRLSVPWDARYPADIAAEIAQACLSTIARA